VISRYGMRLGMWEPSPVSVEPRWGRGRPIWGRLSRRERQTDPCRQREGRNRRWGRCVCAEGPQGEATGLRPRWTREAKGLPLSDSLHASSRALKAGACRA
jgi:hypothetical protein